MSEEKEEVVLKSSSALFEEFLQSTIWADINSELNVWLEGVRDGLEDPQASERDLFRNQGRAEAIRYVLSLPQVIRETIKIAEEMTQKKREENENG